MRGLIHNNPLYKHIQIDTLALNSLPGNSIPDDLLSAETDVPHDGVDPEIINNIGKPHNSDDFHSDDDIVYNKDSEMSSFLQLPEAQQQEEDAMLEQLQNQIMDWPSIENEPLSEFTTPFMATLSFPTLFPNSDGDPTNPAILREVSFSDKVKHLIKLGSKVNDKWTFPLASHPRFGYWALSMVQRKRMLQQASVFIKQNPGEAHLTSEELRELVETNNGSALLSKVFRYAANITGTPSYWHKVRSDLKAIITQVGPPTFFLHFLLQICTG